MKIVFFNAPPRAGKDTATAIMVKRTHGLPVSFAAPLKRQTAALLSVSFDELEAIKDIPHAALKGGTPRQYMINLSEKMIKPCYGTDFFGHVAVDYISNNIPLVPIVYFSDSGFHDEAVPVVNKFGIENCVKFNLFRKGCDYSKDSRSYWEMPGLPTINTNNDRTIEHLATFITSCLEERSFI